MIPILQQPEPSGFDQKVRQKGLTWFQGKQIDITKALPKKTEPENHWTACIPELRKAYNNICAYVCIYISPVTGSATVEHFKPKSKYPSLTYEWSNYLLVCGVMNGRKRDFEDVLSPFELEPETFYLDLFDGSIFPNPNTLHLEAAKKTITRLQLNHPECKELRLSLWDEFLTLEISKTQLQKKSPFVYFEAQRQNQI